MKDLCSKLYKEYGLLDIINKKEINNISDNNTEINDNNYINDNNDNTIDNNENKNDNDSNNTNNTNSNIVSSNEPKPKMVGRKRKRYYLQYKFHFKL
jgi:hypothetical protein